MSTVPFLQGVLKRLLPGRAAVIKPLNAKPHFVPVDMKSLAISLHYLKDTDLNTFFTELDNYIKKYRVLHIVTSTVYNFNGMVVSPIDIEKLLTTGPLVLVHRTTGTIAGILFSSFSSAQTQLFTGFLNSKMQDYANKKLYEERKKLNPDKKGRIEGFDVGHTYIKESNKYSSIADTPLSIQINNLNAVVNDLLDNGAAGEIYRSAAEHKSGFVLSGKRRSELLAVKNRLDSFFKTFEDKHSYGQKVTMVLNKDIRGLLVNVSANITLIQDREENQGEFARAEAALAAEVIKILSTIHFSKNAETEIADRVTEVVIKGKITSRNIKVSKTISEDNRTNKVILKNGGISAGTIKPKKLRAASGAFQSVSNLEALLRMSLYETIKKNMAPPGLTFQTGTFAKSVKLRSVQYDNRSGAVTAFLSYMKYPYATFEPGGRQGSMDRSPSSLVVRSVREIATKLTKARMQAIII